MSDTLSESQDSTELIDAFVVGAGFSGLHLTHQLAKRGWSFRSVEAGDSVGGTWYWNRYPGARTDSDASIYSLQITDEFSDWTWENLFPKQPEVLGYLNYVADRFDLRRHYRFNTRVVSAHWDDVDGRWLVTTDQGQRYRAKYFLSGAGFLSSPVRPDIPGAEAFGGTILHTASWPEEGLDLTGLRVAQIGVGSTGVQLLPQIAAQAGSVVVFQRTPTYVVPQDYTKLDELGNEALRRSIPGNRVKVRTAGLTFPYDLSGRLGGDFSEDERREIFEEGWKKGGFRFLVETFDDLIVDPETNESACRFLRSKIREIVKDPDVAESLSPYYPYAAKRPPQGNGFYEAFNRDNVTLVDLQKTPLQKITRSGIATTQEHFDVDVIIFATGFQAATGALSNIDVVGRDGRVLAKEWTAATSTFQSVAKSGFPNFFMMLGPHVPGGNMPTIIEHTSNWVFRLLDEMEQGGHKTVEPTQPAEDEWTRHLNEFNDSTLIRRGTEVNSWFTGSNVENKKDFTVYFGSSCEFFDRLDRIADSGWEGLAISD